MGNSNNFYTAADARQTRGRCSGVSWRPKPGGGHSNNVGTTRPLRMEVETMQGRRRSFGGRRPTFYLKQKRGSVGQRDTKA